MRINLLFFEFLGFGHDLAIKCMQHGMPVFAGCLTEKV